MDSVKRSLRDAQSSAKYHFDRTKNAIGNASSDVVEKTKSKTKKVVGDVKNYSSRVARAVTMRGGRKKSKMSKKMPKKMHKKMSKKMSKKCPKKIAKIRNVLTEHVSK